MATTPEPLVVNTFQLPNGQPVASGYMLIRLNMDGNVSGSSLQLCGNTIRLPLDNNGILSSSYLFWPNNAISPSGTYYIYSIYTAQGELVLGPTKVTFDSF